MIETLDTSDLDAIREAGFKALTDALGFIGAVRFLQQIDGGHGDYTKEKYERPDESFDEIEARMKALKTPAAILD